MMNLRPVTPSWNVDLGFADLFTRKYDIPYFFENPGKRMMKEPDDKVISFRSWDRKYILQFSLDTYHGQNCILITSTAQDCVFMLTGKLNFDSMKEWANRQSDKKHPINGSFSGYFTFGKKLLEQIDRLQKNLKDRNMYITDDAFISILEELRRRNEENE